MCLGVDAEHEAIRILKAAGVRPGSTPSPVTIAKGIGLPIHKVSAKVLRGADGMLCRVRGHWAAFIGDHLRPARFRFVVAHEVAERWLKDVPHGLRGAEKERAADSIAAGLCAPREPFAAAVEEYGAAAFEQLSLDFSITQTCAALRVGEVCCTPLAVVHPSAVYVRGPVKTLKHDQEWIRRMAGRRRCPGVQRVRLTDEPRRVALLETA